jgi:hypothetical protein
MMMINKKAKDVHTSRLMVGADFDARDYFQTHGGTGSQGLIQALSSIMIG